MVHEKMNANDDFFCTKLCCDIEQVFIPSSYCKISDSKASDCTIYHFTHGQCAAFAIALYREFSYPLLCIWTDWSPYDYKDESTPKKRLEHAFCKNPHDERTVIDARGVKPLEYILHDVYKDKYSEENVVSTNEEVLIKDGVLGGVKELEIKKAQAFIKKHIERYKVD